MRYLSVWRSPATGPLSDDDFSPFPAQHAEPLWGVVGVSGKDQGCCFGQEEVRAAGRYGS